MTLSLESIGGIMEPLTVDDYGCEIYALDETEYCDIALERTPENDDEGEKNGIFHWQIMIGFGHPENERLFPHGVSFHELTGDEIVKKLAAAFDLKVVDWDGGKTNVAYIDEGYLCAVFGENPVSKKIFEKAVAIVKICESQHKKKVEQKLLDNVQDIVSDFKKLTPAEKYLCKNLLEKVASVSDIYSLDELMKRKPDDENE